MLIVFLLSLFFLIVAVVVRSNIHKNHQEQVARIKQEERELDDRLETLLVRRRRMGREAEALEDRIVLLEHGAAEVGQSGVSSGTAAGNGERAASWLLSSGKLSLDNYGKVLDLIKKSNGELGFLDACLVLKAISRSDAELASNR
ncbi:MAG: hypothetical protein AB7D07_02040 [Desulfovibrionaceae bacterium]|jgi:hypothetical protein